MLGQHGHPLRRVCAACSCCQCELEVRGLEVRGRGRRRVGEAADAVEESSKATALREPRR